jgi:hypothetical protein
VGALGLTIECKSGILLWQYQMQKNGTLKCRLVMLAKEWTQLS